MSIVMRYPLLEQRGDGYLLALPGRYYAHGGICYLCRTLVIIRLEASITMNFIFFLIVIIYLLWSSMEFLIYNINFIKLMALP